MNLIEVKKENSSSSKQYIENRNVNTRAVLSLTCFLGGCSSEMETEFWTQRGITQNSLLAKGDKCTTQVLD